MLSLIYYSPVPNPVPCLLIFNIFVQANLTAVFFQKYCSTEISIVLSTFFTTCEFERFETLIRI